MKQGFVSFSALGWLLLANPSMATAPQLLITHNNTNVESNAYIAGTIPSANPSKPNSTNLVPWIIVSIACTGHLIDQTKCPALIKMETNTAHPVNLGEVTMDIKTGEINPKRLAANGYTFTVVGLAEATLNKD